MKKFVPILFYLLFLISGGLFIFYWVFALMRDVNRIYKKRVFDAGLILGACMVLYIAGMAVLFAPAVFPGYWPAFFTGDLLLAFVLIVPAGTIIMFLLPVLIFIKLDNFEPGKLGGFGAPLIVFGMGTGLPLLYLQWRVDRIEMKSGN